MKPAAILCLLWPRFTGAVGTFLATKPNTTVLTPRAYYSDELAAIVSHASGQLIIIDDLLTEQDQFFLEQRNRELSATVDGILETHGWASFSERVGMPAEDLGNLISEQARTLFPVEATLVQMLEKAREIYQINLLAVSEDLMPIGKTAALWSKNHRIPSLHILHGVALAQPYTVHERLYCDVIATYGERGTESYLDAGIPGERIRITGNPAWDHYRDIQTRRQDERKRLLAQNHLDPEAPIIVFGPTWAHNLSALADEHVFGRSLAAFLEAIEDLRSMGLKVNAVIKDRAHNLQFGRHRFAEICTARKLDPHAYLYLADAPEPWIVAADIIVGVDSNFLVEAMLCGTPAVNILTDCGLRFGPSFEGDSGVIEVTPEELAAALRKLLNDTAFREASIARLNATAPRYNAGVDGKARERVGQLMAQLYDQSATQQRHVWQECLDVPDIDATGYHGGARGDLVEQFTNDPKILLDIGCAAGGTGALFKLKYPHGKVWGVELNKSAAAIAATRLDRVLVGKFEELDLEAEGLAKGSVDAVILADVLEHMYNPWQVMVALKPYLSPTAQIMVSIPNVRNLALMDDLSRGYFRYEKLGLLDITHIRFFTYKELLRFFHETGYHVTRNTYGIDPRLGEIFARYKDRVPCDVDTGKLVLKNVTPEELWELCSIQFYMKVEPGVEQLTGYEQPGQFQQAPAQVYAKFLTDHQITKPEAQMFEHRLEEWGARPSVLIPIYVAPDYLSLLGATIQSLSDQYYFDIKLVIVSPLAPTEGFAAGDRITWHTSDAAPYAAIGEAIAASPCDWVLPLNAGDQIAPHALLLLLEAAHSHPEWHLIYTDEDQRNPENGQFDKPFFKPDFNLDYLYSLPYIGDTPLISRRILEITGGFQAAYGGMADYDLQLRILETVGAAGIGHVADVLVHRSPLRGTTNQPTTELVEAGKQALTAHFARTGVADVEVSNGTLPGTYSIRYTSRATSVSIVMLVRNRQATLQRSLEALLEKTGNIPCEIIIIDAASDDQETRRYLETLDGFNEDSIRVYFTDTLDGGFYRLANQAVGAARGEFILFLAADAVPLQDHWLETLLAHGQRTDVAAVGGRLLDQAGKIVSAGRILGMAGHAESPFTNQRFDQPGYFGRLQCTQALSALSEACLLIRREAFLEAGGFDEGYNHLFGDVDLCLRLQSGDQHLVWTPEASLLHEPLDFVGLADLQGEAKQTAFETDKSRLFDSWLPKLTLDPAFNRNLSIYDPDFVIETRPELTKIGLPWHPLPTMLAIPMDDAGCGNYRVMQPFHAALASNHIHGWCRYGIFNPLEVARMAPDVLYVQRHVLDVHQAALRNYRRHFSAKIIFELDDLMWAVPEKSIHRADLPRDLKERVARSFESCDRLIVTTEPLAEAYRELVGDIKVVPNSIDLDIWGALAPKRSQGGKPRVGWAGGISHTGDLEIIAPVIEILKDEVEWVFFGMTPNVERSLIGEYHGGVPFKDYPAKLASLDLDVALAPLEYNEFNECKSNLRLLEYGVLGYPVIATDITPYRCGLPVTLVENSTEVWVEAIRKAVGNIEKTHAQGDLLRTLVREYHTLEKTLPTWTDAWFKF